MKSKRKIIFIGLLLAAFSFMGFIVYMQNFNDKEEQETLSSPTELLIHNPSTTDSLLVFLTLNIEDGWVNDVNGIFGISSTKKSQGSFYIKPTDTVSYTSNKPFGANISFWKAPLNCPYPAPTLYEVTLNNAGTVPKAQETVDISCVAGVTTYGKFTLADGGTWTNGRGDTITSITNSSLYNNTGISGVYPFGCTNCVNTNGTPVCAGAPPYATPNSINICNVSRPATAHGGHVLLTYIGN